MHKLLSFIEFRGNSSILKFLMSSESILAIIQVTLRDIDYIIEVYVGRFGLWSCSPDTWTRPSRPLWFRSMADLEWNGWTNSSTVRPSIFRNPGATRYNGDDSIIVEAKETKKGGKYNGSAGAGSVPGELGENGGCCSKQKDAEGFNAQRKIALGKEE